MGGKSTSTQTTQAQQTTAPWAPTIAPLNDIISALNGQIGNYSPTGTEISAINQLKQNAANSPNFTPQVTQLTNDLFSGGPDRSGMVKDAYSNYQQQSAPYLSADYLNPYTNPAFSNYLNTVTNDISGRVNGMFAGAGRDLSGANLQTLARGITEGTAPIFANQYNQNVATQTGAMNNLYNAGNTSAQALSLLDQNLLNNRLAGANTASLLPSFEDTAPNRTLQAESFGRGLPLSNLQQLISMLGPLAGLGGTSNSTGSSQGTQTMSGAQQFALIANGLGNLGLKWPQTPVK